MEVQDATKTEQILRTQSKPKNPDITPDPRVTEKRETPPDRGRQESRNEYGDRAETSRGR